MRPSLRTIVLSLGSLTAACAETSTSGEDGEHDSFLGDGKLDVYGISETSYEAAAIIDFASTATAARLSAAGISSTASASTLAATRPFASLVALDAVAYTGPAYFSKLLTYVTDHDLVGSCGDGLVQPLIESCDDASCAPCTGRTLLDDRHRIASIPIPSDALIRGLPNDELFLVGKSNSGTVKVGPRTLSGQGIWIARVSGSGSVPYLTWLVEGYPLAAPTANVVGARVQVQVRTNTFHPDDDRIYSVTPSTGVSSLLGRLSPTKKLLAWNPNEVLVNFANDGGGVSMEMLEPDSQERLWAVICPRSIREAAYGHDQVWCSETAQPSQQRLRRYRVTGTTVTQLPPLELGTSGGYVQALDATPTGFALRTAMSAGLNVTTYFSPSGSIVGDVTIMFDSTQSNAAVTSAPNGQALLETHVAPTAELGIAQPGPVMYYTLREHTSAGTATVGTWLTSDPLYPVAVPVVTPTRVAIAATARFELAGSAPYALVLFERPSGW